MKKTGLILLTVLAMVSCNNSGSITEGKLDSIGEKLDSSADRIWDSTRQKAGDIKDRIENRLERRDSADTLNH